MEFAVGDVVKMKKPHPCGSDEWEILRTGADFKLRCMKCQRLVMLSRVKFEKGFKKLVKSIDESVENEINFKEVQKDELEILEKLARTIWNECFADILTKEQIDYMLDKFQSTYAFNEQIDKESYRYFFIRDGAVNLGYTGVSNKGDRLFLSKLYLLKEHRGKGYARAAFKFITDVAKSEGLGAVWLTVNKNNQRAIDFYKISGFHIISEQVSDIGNGFVMDDYIMEKEIID